MNAISHLNEVNTQRVFVNTVSRLQHYLQMRWPKEIHKVQNREHRSAEFHDLVSFVDKAAEEVTDSVYSRLPTAGRGSAVLFVKLECNVQEQSSDRQAGWCGWSCR